MDNTNDKPSTPKVEVLTGNEISLDQFTEDLKIALAKGAVASTEYLSQKYVKQINNNTRMLIGNTDNNVVAKNSEQDVYQEDLVDTETEE